MSVDFKKLLTPTWSDYFDMAIDYFEVNEILPIAVDIGYGGVKYFTPYSRGSFPALSISKSETDFLTFIDSDIIYYEKDSDGEIQYLAHVGDRAFSSSNNRDFSDKALYSQHRIKTKSYNILFRTAVAKALIDKNNEIRNFKRIHIITGLPEDYVDTQKDILRNRLKGNHSFDIKFGGNKVKHIEFELKSNDITILSQPAAITFSMAYDCYGKCINEDLLLDNNYVIVDGGFYSLDVHTRKQREHSVADSDTDEKHAMRNVLIKLQSYIKDKYKKSYSIPKLLYLLKSNINKIEFISPDTNDKVTVDLSKPLQSIIKSLGEELAEQLNQAFDYFEEFGDVIVAGGSGKVFYEVLKSNINASNILLSEKTGSNKPYENFEANMAVITGYFNFYMARLIAKNPDIQLIKKNTDKPIITINEKSIDKGSVEEEAAATSEK